MQQISLASPGDTTLIDTQAHQAAKIVFVHFFAHSTSGEVVMTEASAVEVSAAAAKASMAERARMLNFILGGRYGESSNNEGKFACG